MNSETRVMGDTAYEVGTYEGTRAGQAEKGSYLVVLKKLAGKWKLVAESGTPQLQMLPQK